MKANGFFQCSRCGAKTDMITGGQCSECWVRLNPPLSPIVQAVVACRGCGEENVRLLREVIEYRQTLRELHDAVMNETGDDTVEETMRTQFAIRRAAQLLNLVPPHDPTGGTK